MRYITKTVWVLSVVSLFTDIASEMLYPVMPVYLESIGFSVVLIGVLEGIAESVAGFSKGYFGNLSDQSGKRVPFVRTGYLLSGLSKPMMALSALPLWIFFARTLDRLGKGIRTAPRDAMLSDEATRETKGRVFGFHRSMDTTGAVLGPLLALAYLHYFPGHYISLFLIAFIPGMLAFAASLFLKDSRSQAKPPGRPVRFFTFLGYWKRSNPAYRRLLTGLLLFTLFNSSDVFLLLRIKESGLNDTYVIGIYIFYNLVYALFAFPLGILSEKIGLKKMYIAGLVLFAAVYAGMAAESSTWLYLALFFLYGLYAAATEGISKAWISNITERTDTATAIGTYTGFQSLCTLLASSLAGLIWYHYGAAATFLVTAGMTLLISIYLAIAVEAPEK